MSYTKEPIAVIGSGCRFPGGSTNPSKLWGLLSEPKDVLKRIDRFRADNFFNQDGHYHGASNVLHAYLLAEEVKHFDHQFFNIPLSEAEAIDPQQRLLMETVYESLEAAGLSVSSLSDTNTGVYVGIMCDDFNQIIFADPENVPTYAATGTSRSIVSNRVSYFFNWHGPSMTIDTACSSSLIAVHQAVQVLRSGECPVAIAAGSNLILSPAMFVAESNLNMLSPHGRSRMWDASANGYARGEGVGCVVMKTLSAALRDGDHIECIIRETGINQDGKTPGITMPSSDSQAQMIRDTYARAGLDPTKATDRCQFFEAHGTGTPAGDPQEARAIYKVFFDDDAHKQQQEKDDGPSDDVLYVGSIKTVIGHTEGTAGIAGLMKASLAMQNRTIPPNMLFTKLNPDIKPYYGNLKIPVRAQKWPELPAGVPMRCSVNSFGFGGANAHAIIEEYRPDLYPSEYIPQNQIASSTPTTTTTIQHETAYPFVFSATTEKSLAAQLKSYLDFIDSSPIISLATLSWSLFRRTSFNFRIALSATSFKTLAVSIEKALADFESKKSPLGVRANPKSSRDILGVFTGQGAQWPTMGKELVLSSALASSIFDSLDESLRTLPDGPDWTLREQMFLPSDQSRVGQAAISQPLCTAVQIMLVELLKRAGTKFSAVVGHSSGEIGCAYTAGFLSAQDAIRIAYYRGKFAPLAKGGAMIAAGTDSQDAKDLCSLPKLAGKAQLAADNSSASVTISGDQAAIDLVEIIMQDEQKFARKLKVDTAYHSHHMKICSDPYLKALEKCNVQILEPAAGAPRWHSSVVESSDLVTGAMSKQLQGEYWRDNMLRPVLFAQALRTAVEAIGSPGLVLEVGPHPALQGPASLTIEEATNASSPYYGTLARGKNDMLALSTAIGSIWSALGAADIDLQGYQRAFNPDDEFQISKALPCMAWDHDKIVWSETRISKQHRLRAHAKHELLGIRSADETEGELRWRNYLKPKEMPWAKGHKIQGQIVFPAAGFAVMAFEAARYAHPTEEVRLMQLQNFVIHKALSFMDENTSVESAFKLYNIERTAHSIQADFACYTCLGKDSIDLSLVADGRVRLELGSTPAPDALPPRPKWADHFVPTQCDYFYENLLDIGYGYTDMFMGITELHRTHGGSRGLITITPDEESVPQRWVIHPAIIDVAFQGIFAAVGAPGDGRLWTLYLPTVIDKITINPSACEALSSCVDVPLPFDAHMLSFTPEDLTGDIDVYDEDGQNAVLQIQGLHVSPIKMHTVENDRNTFAAITWGAAIPDLSSDFVVPTLSGNDEKIALFAERLAFFIVRELAENVDATKIEASGTEQQRAVLCWAQQMVETTKAGEHPICQRNWLLDTWEVLEAPAQRLAANSTRVHRALQDRNRLANLFQHIPIVGHEVPISDEDIYTELPHWTIYNAAVASLVEQIAFRNRNMRVLELGAGKGATTLAALEVLQQNFASYTVTDAEDSGFDHIKSIIAKDQAARVSTKILRIEQPIADQDFIAGAYDVVIASNVIHTYSDLDQALKNVRALLRPGGFLALLEPTSNASIAIALRGSLTPHWFAGTEEYRKNSPFISTMQWDTLLRSNGFSGVDTATPRAPNVVAPFSVMCSVAEDKKMSLVHQPLLQSGKLQLDTDLLIMGGRTITTFRLVQDLTRVLAPFFNEVITVQTLLDVDDSIIERQPTVISLIELDEPVFKPFTEPKFKALVKLCDTLKKILWVTKGARGEDPFHSMMIAVCRVLVAESQTLRMQVLNFDGSDSPTTDVVAHHLLQLHLTFGFSGECVKPGDPLFTIDREVTVQNGRVLIPRYLPVKAINDHLNSERRRVLQMIDSTETPVRAGVHIPDSAYEFREAPLANVDSQTTTIRVSKSLLSAVRVGNAGRLHIVVGHDESGAKTVAVSEHLQSVIYVPDSHVVKVDVRDDEETALLQSTADAVVAASILADTNGAVLVHDPTSHLAHTLKEFVAEQGRTLAITTSKKTLTGAISIHPSARDTVISAAIPHEVSVFANLSQSPESTVEHILGTRIANLLPRNCHVWNNSRLFSREGCQTGSVDAAVLKNAVAKAIGQSAQKMADLTLIPASQLTSSPLLPLPGHIVDWLADDTLPVSLTQAEHLVRFRSDRTYLLVGLTGQLGLHLVKWMVDRGARHLALASRNPEVPSDWLQDMEHHGANVRLFKMDVTSRNSVRAAHKTIESEMPPVIGVAQGAMILIDALFANNTFTDFEKTLKPKVEGTVHLDEIYSEDTLDFFMVFSSLSCVAGNLGQSAYATANIFMNSLVAGRRMRGLAGCSINMPGIVGLGYLNRDPRKLDRLKASGYVNISEWDFYQFFSEAVLAGHPRRSNAPFEIVAGLQPGQVDGNDDPPVWHKHAKFNPLRKIRTESDSAASSEVNTASVRSRLGEVATEAELHELILQGLLDTLYNRLNMNPEENGIMPDTSIVELGVDSLLAVDMRAWFTKELDLDMPVLKLLGGASVSDLVDDAVARISPALIPLIAREGDKPAEVQDEEVEIDPASISSAAATGTVTTDANEEAQIVAEPLDLPDLDDEVEAKANADSDDSADELGGSALFEQRTPSEGSAQVDVETPPTSAHDTDDEPLKDLSPLSKASEGRATLFSPLPVYAEEPIAFTKKVRMSYGASRFWLLSQYVQDPRVFNLVSHFKLSGFIDLEQSKRCLVALGQRHEAFHTAFFADPENLNEPTMGVMEKTLVHLEYRDNATETDVQAEIKELLDYDFKLEQGEVFRFKLISLNPSTHYVVFGFHHIAMDGFSYNLMIGDINMLYDGTPATPIRTQFSDFAVRQRREVEDGTLDADLQYWKDMYSRETEAGDIVRDFPEPLPLFKVAHNARQPLDDYDYTEASMSLDARTVRQIKAACRRNRLTTFQFFLSVLRTFLFRHLDVDDLAIGIADANRIDADVQSTIGFMLNLLPLRFKKTAFNADAAFKDVAAEVRSTVFEALSHSKLPFDALLEKLDIPRSSTHSPLFQAWMDYKMFQPGHRPTLFGGEVSGAAIVGKNGYDLTLDIDEVDRNGIVVALRMQKSLYSTEPTKILFESFMKLVKSFAADSEASVTSVGLWDDNAVTAVSGLGQGPILESTLPETLSERIGHVAATNADKQAVKDGYGNSYTYAELQHKAQAIATTLTNAGVQPGTRVAVFQQPSSDWVASLLGIWHAGATYIPMDLRSSLGRLADVAASAAPSVILTHDETDAQVVELKTEAKAINISGLEPVTEISKTRAQPKTAAAILFTSGSTGTPKGVIIPHSALRNTIEGLTTQYNLKAERVLQQSAFTFDFSLDQILVGLVNGGSIYVASQEDRLDPLALSRIVSSEKITYTRATPTEYFNWISHGSEDLLKSSEWTFAWAGGETLPHSLRQAFASLHLPGLCLLNSYGPAETITCTKGEVPYLDVDEDDVAEIPVGFPLPNYTVYIVDNTLDIVPQGVSGEIVIGGPSVGGGYLNNERLTDSKFINIAEGSGVVYRTGDVGYLRADGALIFQGRLAGDLQVKIRGMRVDLQDVESCILAASRDVLDKAIVTVREGDLLVAHVQFSPGYSPDESERQAFLRSLRFELPLPVYMLPTVIIPLDSMPTNAHGKTDRAAIQAMPLPQSSQRAGGEALTETEIKLLGIWKDVGLGGESHAAIPVDNQTTFFEMGGNSILLVKLQILISMHFNAKLSLLDLFNAVSLGAMASKIEAAPKSDEIDWEAETKVEEDLVKTEQDLQASVQTPPSTVLVTGATGYLGGRIVQALDALSHVKEIHCVATRSGEDKLKQLSGKVIIHGGNLAAPRLGLSEETFHSLSESADLIIHAGVSRSVLDSYQSLRGANVGATKTLVRLAANRRVPVHYISTGTLSTLGDAPPPSGGSLGYVASKWASERYLSNAARELDLPVTVHRIVPAPDTEGESTADTAALEEVLAHIKQVSTTLGVAPTFFGLDDWSIDLIRTNRVVNAILSAKNSTSSTSTPSEHVSLVEHTCDVQLKCGSELETQAAKKNSGEEATVEKIAFPRWLARARKAGLEWQIGSLDNFPLEE